MNMTDDRILYCDSSFAVVNKLIGEICESTGDSSSIINSVRPLLEKGLATSLPYIQPVHRIDRPVSGCLLLSFNRDTSAFFTEEFNNGHITKRYDAIVEMVSRDAFVQSGRLEHGLLFDRRRQKAVLCPATRREKGYKRAVLAWDTAGFTDRYACIRVYPETGRTHQIRAQLAAAGMPIKGDLKYGAKRSEPGGGIRLHARRLQCTHPVTGDRLTVTAPVIGADTLWQAFPGEDQ